MIGDVLIIGVGNPDRGDDAIGLALARALRADATPGASVLECSGEGTGLLEAWRGADAVVLLDAVDAGLPVGSIVRLDARRDLVRKQIFPGSTHDFGVAEAIALARALGELPEQLIVLGVQGSDFAPGASLSAPALRATDEALRRVREEVTRLRTQQHETEPERALLPSPLL